VPEAEFAILALVDGFDLTLATLEVDDLLSEFP